MCDIRIENGDELPIHRHQRNQATGRQGMNAIKTLAKMAWTSRKVFHAP
jgi:hypothetical protein